MSNTPVQIQIMIIWNLKKSFVLYKNQVIHLRVQQEFSCHAFSRTSQRKCVDSQFNFIQDIYAYSWNNKRCHTKSKNYKYNGFVINMLKWIFEFYHSISMGCFHYYFRFSHESRSQRSKHNLAVSGNNCCFNLYMAKKWRTTLGVA